MENEQKNERENVSAGKMTRREVLWFGALGTGFFITGLHLWARRRAKSRNPFGITEIVIEGPFEKYGSFTPESLGRKYTVKREADFNLQSLGFSRGTYNNNVGISFAFSGKEAPDRKMEVSFIVYDTEGKVIGGTKQIVGDQRIAAREWNSTGNMFFMEPRSSLATRLNVGKDISHIGRVEIFAMEIK